MVHLVGKKENEMLNGRLARFVTVSRFHRGKIFIGKDRSLALDV
jgi:hypothetical protein